MLFHVFLTREFDGALIESYRGGFESETSALVNLADALGFYAGAAGRIESEDGNGNTVSIRYIGPAVHPFDPGDIGYIAPQNRVSA